MWGRIDDGWHRHWKQKETSRQAQGTFLAMLSYTWANPHLLGRIDQAVAMELARDQANDIEELLRVELLEPRTGGYVIHDWMDYLAPEVRRMIKAGRFSEAASERGREAASKQWAGHVKRDCRVCSKRGRKHCKVHAENAPGVEGSGGNPSTPLPSPQPTPLPTPRPLYPTLGTQVPEIIQGGVMPSPNPYPIPIRSDSQPSTPGVGKTTSKPQSRAVIKRGQPLAPSAFAKLWETHYGDRKTNDSRKRAQSAFESTLPDSGFVEYLRSKAGQGEFALHLRTYINATETEEQESEEPEDPIWSPPPPAPETPPPPPHRREIPEADLVQLRTLLDEWNSRGPLHVSTFARLQIDWAQSTADLTAFASKVRARLARYDASPEPEKARFLGTISTFLTKGKWLDEPVIPAKGEIVRLPMSAEAAAIPDSEF